MNRPIRLSLILQNVYLTKIAEKLPNFGSNNGENNIQENTP